MVERVSDLRVAGARGFWAFSSAVERFSDKEEVDGSTPSVPTPALARLAEAFGEAGKARKDEVNGSIPLPPTNCMSDAGETFFTSVGCMDGRVQKPVAEFGREKFGAEFADTITEAGLVGKLATDQIDQALINSLKFKIADVSVGKHRSKGIIVHGHQDCAGNPVNDELHKEQTKKAAEFVGSLAKDLPVIPVFVEKVDGKWKVFELN